MAIRGCEVVLDEPSSGSAAKAAVPVELADDAGVTYQAQADAFASRLRGAVNSEGPGHSSGIQACIRVRPLLEVERASLATRLPGRTGASFAEFEYEAVLADPPRRVHLLSEKKRLGRPTGKLACQCFA